MAKKRWEYTTGEKAAMIDALWNQRENRKSDTKPAESHPCEICSAPHRHYLHMPILHLYFCEEHAQRIYDLITTNLQP